MHWYNLEWSRWEHLFTNKGHTKNQPLDYPSLWFRSLTMLWSFDRKLKFHPRVSKYSMSMVLNQEGLKVWKELHSSEISQSRPHSVAKRVESVCKRKFRVSYGWAYYQYNGWTYHLIFPLAHVLRWSPFHYNSIIDQNQCRWNEYAFINLIK